MAAGKGFLAPLQALLRQPPPAVAVDHCRLLTISVVTALALMINHYLAIHTSLTEALRALAALLGESPRPWLQTLYRSRWAELAGHGWWLLCLATGYVLIPMLVARWWLGERLRDYGLGLGDTLTHWRYYALFAAVMAGLAIAASFSDTFLHTYPFYRQAARSWTDLLLWELIYIAQFFCIEFFYRGFLLRSLQPSFGSGAIYVSSLVYLTIHLPKPLMECVGSLLFGLMLCLLALLSRSIWGGVLIHVCLAVSMDLLSLGQRGAWPGF